MLFPRSGKGTLGCCQSEGQAQKDGVMASHFFGSPLDFSAYDAWNHELSPHAESHRKSR
jgi:hypothetical protein